MHAFSQTSIQRNTEHAYIALHGLPVTAAYHPIPGQVHTDRNRLTRSQIAHRYLKSIADNPDVDIKKPVMPQAPRMTQKRETRSAEEDFAGITLRRRAAGSEMQQNATAPASPSAYEWHISERCNDLESADIADRCRYVTHSDYPLNTKEAGVTFETIGTGELPLFFNRLPVFIEDNIQLQALKIIETDKNLEDIFSYSILADGHSCGKVNEKKQSVCKTFTAEDPVAQIDQFLRNNDQGFFNKMVVTNAETIEAWGARSKLLRGTDMIACAVREKNWLAKHIAWGTAGAVLGLAAIGTIIVRNRDKLIHAAVRVKSAFQSCSHPACCNVNEEDQQDESAVHGDANALNTIHIGNAESSSVVDSSDASTISEPDFSRSSSSSTERSTH